MGLKVYIVRRMLEIIPTLIFTIIFIFLLVHSAPGDVALYLAGADVVDPEVIETIRKWYGLDKPLHEQFVIYFIRVFSGDLGNSYVYNRPVVSVIAERIPATLLLIFTSSFVSIIIGTLLGAYAAKRHGSKMDTLLSSFSIVGRSMPVFWSGLMLIFLFALRLHLFPTTGMYTVAVERTGIVHVLDLLWHMFLPVLSMSLYGLGRYVRLARSSVVEKMMEAFVMTARAIGYSENTIFLKHILRNAILPVVTIAGLQLGAFMVGATLTETVFAWPGMGRLFYEALISRDYPLIIGNYILLSIILSLATLAIDIIYAFLDPRIKLR